MYPNPFTVSVNLVISNPESVRSIAVLDQLGRSIATYDRSAIRGTMQLGQELDSDFYIIRIYGEDGVQSFTINKNR